MDFQDISMTESCGLKSSSLSCRLSTEFGNQDSSSSMQQTGKRMQLSRPAQGQGTRNKQERYRCYECAGNVQRSSGCRTCNGLKEVKDGNVMVGLMMQVMCAKLNHDVPKLKNFPKLEFSSQNKISSKSNKNKIPENNFCTDISNSAHPSTSGHRSKKTGVALISSDIVLIKCSKQPRSEGNKSVKASDSLNSSFQSVDSYRKPVSISNKLHSKSKEGPRQIPISSSGLNNAVSTKNRRPYSAYSSYSTGIHGYPNQPNFKRQQISEIKEESYVTETETEESSVNCECCHREGEAGSVFYECKICKCFKICSECYNLKLIQFDAGSNGKTNRNQETGNISMKRQKSMYQNKTNLYEAEPDKFSSSWEHVEFGAQGPHHIEARAKSQEIELVSHSNEVSFDLPNSKLQKASLFKEQHSEKSNEHAQAGVDTSSRVHEHPLTRYVVKEHDQQKLKQNRTSASQDQEDENMMQNTSEVELYQFGFDPIKEEREQTSSKKLPEATDEEGQIYQTYGKAEVNARNLTDVKFRNLFRSYDLLEQQAANMSALNTQDKLVNCNQNSGQHQYLSLSIDVIQEEKESPSASQISCLSNPDRSGQDVKQEGAVNYSYINDSGVFAGYTMKSAQSDDVESHKPASLVNSSVQNEDDIDCNISVTVSNHLESPESQKELNNAEHANQTPEPGKQKVFTMKRTISNQFNQFELSDSNVRTNNMATGQKSIFKNDNIFSNFYNCNNFKLSSDVSEDPSSNDMFVSSNNDNLFKDSGSGLFGNANLASPDIKNQKEEFKDKDKLAPNKERLIEHLKINRDVSQWSYNSKQDQDPDQAKQDNRSEINPDILEQSSDVSLVVGPAFTGIPAEMKSNTKLTNIEKEKQMDAPSRPAELILVLHPDSPLNAMGNGRNKQTSSKSVNHDQVAYDCKHENVQAEPARKQKEKSYTEKKDHKFATVRHYAQADQPEQRQNDWDDQVLINTDINIQQMISQANMPTPINLFVNEGYRDEIADTSGNKQTCPLLINFNSREKEEPVTGLGECRSAFDVRPKLQFNDACFQANQTGAKAAQPSLQEIDRIKSESCETQKFNGRVMDLKHSQESRTRPINMNQHTTQVSDAVGVLESSKRGLNQVTTSTHKPTDSNIPTEKVCSQCHREIHNRTMYMKCETCEKKYGLTYELCGICFGVKAVVDNHMKKLLIECGKASDEGKHLFKANLYRRQETVELLDMDHEDELDNNGYDSCGDKQKQGSLKRQLNSKDTNYMQSSIRESANNPSEQEKEFFIPNKKDLQKRASRIALWSDLSLGDSSFLNEGINYQRPNHEERQKTILDTDKEGRERWENSFGYRDSKCSSNVDIGDNWLLDSNDPKTHTSYSLVPVKYSFSADQDRNDENKQLQNQNPSFGPIIKKVLANTNAAGDAEVSQYQKGKSKQDTSIVVLGAEMSNKNRKDSPSHLDPRRLHISNNESPDRSEYSSRIKVDCGSESESQHYNEKSMGNEHQHYSSHNESINQQDRNSNMLGQAKIDSHIVLPMQHPSMRIGSESEKTNILGGNYAVSESEKSEGVFQSGNDENDTPQKKNVRKNILNQFKQLQTSSWKPKHYAQQDFINQVPQKTKQKKYTSQLQSPVKKYVERDEQNQVKNKLSSRKKQYEKDKSDDKSEGLIMSFLGKIEKSEKLSKSEASSLSNSKSKQKSNNKSKQHIHFDIEGEQKVPNKLDKQQEEAESSGRDDDDAEQYVFEDYTCDVCTHSPVNARYHCKECEDYDLCENCYESLRVFHEHSRKYFEKITKAQEEKLLTREKQKREDLLKSILDRFVPQNTLENKLSSKKSSSSARQSLQGSQLANNSRVRDSLTYSTLSVETGHRLGPPSKSTMSINIQGPKQSANQSMVCLGLQK